MGFLCIDWAVIRNQQTAAPALKIGKTAAIATAVSLIAVFPAYGLVKDFEDFSVEARTTATVCQRAESVTVCVWPENAKNLSVFVSVHEFGRDMLLELTSARNLLIADALALVFLTAVIVLEGLICTFNQEIALACFASARTFFCLAGMDIVASRWSSPRLGEAFPFIYIFLCSVVGLNGDSIVPFWQFPLDSAVSYESLIFSLLIGLLLFFSDIPNRCRR